MNTPLIFLAFANDQDAHLDLLKQESRKLYDTLEELERKEYVKVHREESADAEELFTDFARRKDQVAIFHYGGHASGTRLRLESGEGDAQGLAQMLGEQENLKLVFLNGCSSKGQVQALFDAGVKAVIATSVPIKDDKAVMFAERFYESLAHRRTIDQAFNMASAFLLTNYGDKLDAQHRGIVMPWGGQPEVEELPWGLYYKEGHEDIRNYKLPYYRPIGLPKEMMNYIGSSFTANRYIVSVLDEMCKFNPDIYHQMVVQRDGESIKKDSREYPLLIIENFPWPIGSQIRLLRLKDAPNLERLKHLVSTYIVTSKVLYFILLSDLWEARHHLADKSITWDHISLDREAYMGFDFFAQIGPLYEKLSEVVTPFVTEFEMLYEAIKDGESQLNTAHRMLEELRSELASEPPSSDLEKRCEQTEKAVRVILLHAAFLANYRMLTVRNVAIDKPRFELVEYEHEMGPLNARQALGLNLYQDAHSRRKSHYADSSSVVLVANEKRLSQALNLSPFIIDKNTFVQVKKSETTEKDRLAHVFLLGWQEDDRVTYVAVEHSIFNSMAQSSDQVHTDMTLSDFVEGKNIEGEQDAQEDALDDVFGDLEDDAGGGEISDEERVFLMLKNQFNMLTADLNP